MQYPTMSSTSFAQYLAVSGRLPNLEQLSKDTVRVGFLAPLSGPLESWGLPGLYGCQLWAERLNAAGGLLVGKQRHPVEIISYDTVDDIANTLQGVRELVENYRISFLLTLGGETLRSIQNYLNDRKILTSTLLPSDLSPDTPYLIAPSETHPVFVVTGVQYICKTIHPKSVALCAQEDFMGLPSLATYRAAFHAEGVRIVKQIRYNPEDADAGKIVSRMMDSKPDILCWCTSYPEMVHALTEAAYRAGFEGKILSCTADGYDRLIALTDSRFMEGFTFQFPDFDDPALSDRAFFLKPRKFFQDYQKQFPNSWSAVSWEYAASLDLWKTAVESASTIAPVSVLAAMKIGGRAKHAFGPANWWGRALFGIDNALVGDWPVVQIRNGKAKIMQFESVTKWLEIHEQRLMEEMHQLDQMWYQRS